MNDSRNLTAEDLNRHRKRLLTMHFDAGVGHIGGNLSALDAMLIIFHEFLSPTDSFVLSKGHAAGALYVTLWGLERLSDDDLKQFHRDDTLLPGHPPTVGIPDIRFATGSLGHGLSLAAGTALGLRFKGKTDRVFCLTSDGEWQEGSTWEALIFANHHALTNLTILIDHNELQGFGSTSEVASMSHLWTRFASFDVDVLVVDGHDPEALRAALTASTDRLRIIIMKTIKGHGVSFMENRMEWHYLPLTEVLYQTAIRDISSL